jgi:hypothetical protein
MGIDGRGYYYRSRRVGGRVVREYVGGGDIGRLAADLDAADRATKDEERRADLAAREQLEALDQPLQELGELVDLLAEAAMLAAGYRRHNRGEWRKSRGRKET